MQAWILKEIPARRWLSVLLTGVLCLGGWQIWLTLRLLEQDEHLELQRSRERLDQVADLALAQLKGSLEDHELGLHQINTLPPAAALLSHLPKGVTFIMVSEKGIRTYPHRPLLFTPMPSTAPPDIPSDFDPVDELEFREREYVRAMASLTPLLLRPSTRAEALLRLARIQYKASQPEAAIHTYDKLTAEDSLTSSGLPYSLLALSARCRILKELGRQQAAQEEASSLRQSLLLGRWQISRATFEYHWAALNELGLGVEQPPKAAMDFSVLVAGLFSRLHNLRTQGSNSSGRGTTARHLFAHVERSVESHQCFA